MNEVTHLTIRGRIPSKKNSRAPFANRGRIPLSEKFREWESDACLQLLKYKGLKLENVDIQLEFWMPDNIRCDLDNKVTSIFDVLQKAEIIVGDHWQVLPSYYVKANGIDKLNPRVEIWIKSNSS